MKKNVRIFLASFLLLAVASAFILPKKHVNPVKTDMKTPVCVDKEVVWNGNHINSMGADFRLGTTTPTTELKDAGNYATTYQAFPTASCSGTAKVCVIRVKYCYDPANLESDPLPSIQEVIDQVYNNYTASGNPSYFPLVSGVYQFTFTKGSPSITITLQVITKN